MTTDRKKNLDKCQIELSKRRNELLMEIEDKFKRSRKENSSQMADIADIASHNAQDELSMMVAGEEIKKIKQIDDALARIDSDKYGICRGCGCDINIERLKALPFATLCVKCKELEENEIEFEENGFSYGREIAIDYDLYSDNDEPKNDKFNVIDEEEDDDKSK